jgi:pyruvate dehydrogenase E2 component (dihydrolipoamide acetyltransferase)
VTVGTDFYSIDTSATASPAAPAPVAAAAPAATSSPETPPPAASSPGKRVEVPVPRMGESISQGVIANWNVGVGSFVNAGDILASIETDKVSPLLTHF